MTRNPLPDHALRVLWRTTTADGKVVDAVFLPQADDFIIAIRVDGLARDARGFTHQSDALAWADEVRRSEPV